MDPIVTITSQPPTNQVRKDEVISPTVKVALDFDQYDKRLNNAHNISATPWLIREDGSAAPLSDYFGGKGLRSGLSLAPTANRIRISFSFTELMVRTTGTFFLRIEVTEWDGLDRTNISTVDTERFTVSD